MRPGQNKGVHNTTIAIAAPVVLGVFQCVSRRDFNPALIGMNLFGAMTAAYFPQLVVGRYQRFISKDTALLRDVAEAFFSAPYLSAMTSWGGHSSPVYDIATKALALGTAVGFNIKLYDAQNKKRKNDFANTTICFVAGSVAKHTLIYLGAKSLLGEKYEPLMSALMGSVAYVTKYAFEQFYLNDGLEDIELTTVCKKALLGAFNQAGYDLVSAKIGWGEGLVSEFKHSYLGGVVEASEVLLSAGIDKCFLGK